MFRGVLFVYNRGGVPLCWIKRLREIKKNTLCGYIQDRHHAFIGCSAIQVSTNKLKSILLEFTNKSFEDSDILYLSFNCQTRELTSLAVWLIIKYLFLIFQRKITDHQRLFYELRKEILYLIGQKILVKWEYQLYELEDIVRCHM